MCRPYRTGMNLRVLHIDSAEKCNFVVFFLFHKLTVFSFYCSEGVQGDMAKPKNSFYSSYEETPFGIRQTKEEILLSGHHAVFTSLH